MRGYYRADDFTAANSIGFLVRRANIRVVSILEAAFADEALSFTQWRLLMCLRDGISHTAAELSRDLDYDSGSLTRIIDDFEMRGIIKRRRSKLDRRVVELELTASGRALVRSLVPRVVDLLNRALGGLSSGEVDQLLDLLRRFLAGVENMKVEARREPRAVQRRRSA